MGIFDVFRKGCDCNFDNNSTCFNILPAEEVRRTNYFYSYGFTLNKVTLYVYFKCNIAFKCKVANMFAKCAVLLRLKSLLIDMFFNVGNYFVKIKNGVVFVFTHIIN